MTDRELAWICAALFFGSCSGTAAGQLIRFLIEKLLEEKPWRQL
jgi:hypothetical protein